MNYLALLGWNPKTTEEFFTMEELIEKFEISHVQKAGAKFDISRLDFFNSHYLRAMDSKTVYHKLLTYLKRYNPEYLHKISEFPNDYVQKVVAELKTKIKNFSEFEASSLYFFYPVKIAEEELYINQKMKITDISMVKNALEVSLEMLKNTANNFADLEDVKNTFIVAIKAAEMKNGQVLWPVRVALSGEEFSAGALELVFILGIKKSIERIEKALSHLS